MQRRPGGLRGLEGENQLETVAQLRRQLNQFKTSNGEALLPEPDYTDDSGMGTEMEDPPEEGLNKIVPAQVSSGGEGHNSREDGGNEEYIFSVSSDEEMTTDDDTENVCVTSGSRRTSQTGYDRQRRPSYTCYHGPLLPRGAPRVGRRAKPRPLRDLDVLQLAAGATVMLAPLTPELLRYRCISISIFLSFLCFYGLYCVCWS